MMHCQVISRSSTMSVIEGKRVFLRRRVCFHSLLYSQIPCLRSNSLPGSLLLLSLRNNSKGVDRAPAIDGAFSHVDPRGCLLRQCFTCSIFARTLWKWTVHGERDNGVSFLNSSVATPRCRLSLLSSYTTPLEGARCANDVKW